MNIKQINVQTAKQWLDAGEAILIDVREPYEHATIKIEGASLHPLQTICCRVIPDTNKKILIHCHSGMRSNNACHKLLLENEDIDVYNIEGGIEAWRIAGFPVMSINPK